VTELDQHFLIFRWLTAFALTNWIASIICFMFVCNDSKRFVLSRLLPSREKSHYTKRREQVVRCQLLINSSEGCGAILIKNKRIILVSNCTSFMYSGFIFDIAKDGFFICHLCFFTLYFHSLQVIVISYAFVSFSLYNVR